LGPGQIFETNNLTLATVVRSAGGEPATHPPVPDDPDAIERAIRTTLATHDLVLVTGGSSVGERDYLPAVFPRVGRLLFHGIAVRPGKPTLAADAHGKLVVGMPGHPTSCLANGYWLLLPILRKLARLPGPGWTDGEVRLDRGYEVPSADLSTVVPLRVDSGRATPTFHGSSAISSLEGANAFALLPPRHPPLRRGVRLTAHFLPSPIAFPSSGPNGRRAS
jgi:molybdenum cofactor synthesis domain-containing protein